LIEISEENFNIIFQENIILRSDRSSTNVTELLVKPGDFVKPGASIAKVQAIAKSNGEVYISPEDRSRILVTTVNDVYDLSVSAKPKVKVGDYVLAGDKLDASTTIEESGQVMEVKDKALIIRKARPFLVSAGTHLHVDNNSLVQQGDQLATIFYERLKTGDIVQGLPKVEELLEGRKPKDPAVLSDTQGKAEIVIEDGIDSLFIRTTDDERKEISIPPGQNIIVNNGDQVEVGQILTDGQPNPHDILEYHGVKPLQQFLVDEVQSVYSSQGVEIANIHLEVIVRQMTRKVKVEEPGDTELLQGELTDVHDFNRINEEIEKDGKVPAGGTPVLLGLTKASLNTESFISAASFQETTRILAEASIKGKSDWLRGLKENVIIGRLIPSGTGFDDEVDAEEILAENRAIVQAI